jgi:hypothetical protein
VSEQEGEGMTRFSKPLLGAVVVVLAAGVFGAVAVAATSVGR